MYRYIIFIIFVHILFTSIQANELILTKICCTEPPPMVLAVQHFLANFFRKRTNCISVMIENSNHTGDYYFRDVIAQIMVPLVQKTLALQVSNAKHRPNLQYYNIIMVDSYKAFRDLDVAKLSVQQDFNEYYLLLFYHNNQSKGMLMKELKKIFDYSLNNYIVNINILIDIKGEGLQLYTYYPFAPGKCFQVIPILVNGVNKTIEKLTASELFPEKTTDLYNCTMTSILWDVQPFIALPNRVGSGPLIFNGIEGSILQLLAEKMNFSIAYKTPPNDEQRGLKSPNGTWTGAVGILRAKNGNLSLGCFRCTLERSTALSPSISYYQTNQVLTVLAYKMPWNTYEVLLYPFSFYVWIILLGIFGTIVISTPLLKLLQMKALAFIYGESEQLHIILHIFGTAVGHPNPTTPPRNFSRYMLLMWLLLTLVLRSSYQGLLYNFLTSQKTIDPPDTTIDLINRKFVLIVNRATYDALSAAPQVRDNLNAIVLNISDTGGLQVLEQNSTKSYVAGLPYDFAIYYIQINQKYDIFHILKEQVYSQQLCIYYPKHSFFIANIDSILLRITATGLIEYWTSNYLDDRIFKKNAASQKEQNKEIALNLQQLTSVFQIHCFIIFVASIVFVSEILYVKYTRIEEQNYEY